MTVMKLNPMNSPNDPPMLENRLDCSTIATSVYILVGWDGGLYIYK